MSMTCALLVFLVILCHEAVLIEGRLLESRRAAHHHDESSTSLSTNQGTAMHQEETSKAEHIDDFRPTSPGHSPGAGHSINN